jgi:hypothetical protein
MSQIAACFIWYICGFEFLQNALNAQWIFKPRCWINIFSGIFPNINIRNMVNYCNLPENDLNLCYTIKAMVVKDLIWFYFDVFRKAIANKGYLKPREDWRILPIVEYYIVKYKGEKNWTVLRYE